MVRTAQATLFLFVFPGLLSAFQSSATPLLTVEDPLAASMPFLHREPLKLDLMSPKDFEIMPDEESFGRMLQTGQSNAAQTNPNGFFPTAQILSVPFTGSPSTQHASSMMGDHVFAVPSTANPASTTVTLYKLHQEQMPVAYFSNYSLDLSGQLTILASASDDLSCVLLSDGLAVMGVIFDGSTLAAYNFSSDPVFAAVAVNLSALSPQVAPMCAKIFVNQTVLVLNPNRRFQQASINATINNVSNLMTTVLANSALYTYDPATFTYVLNTPLTFTFAPTNALAVLYETDSALLVETFQPSLPASTPPANSFFLGIFFNKSKMWVLSRQTQVQTPPSGPLFVKWSPMLTKVALYVQTLTDAQSYIISVNPMTQTTSDLVLVYAQATPTLLAAFSQGLVSLNPVFEMLSIPVAVPSSSNPNVATSGFADLDLSVILFSTQYETLPPSFMEQWMSQYSVATLVFFRSFSNGSFFTVLEYSFGFVPPPSYPLPIATADHTPLGVSAASNILGLFENGYLVSKAPSSYLEVFRSRLAHKFASLPGGIYDICDIDSVDKDDFMDQEMNFKTSLKLFLDLVADEISPTSYAFAFQNLTLPSTQPKMLASNSYCRLFSLSPTVVWAYKYDIKGSMYYPYADGSQTFASLVSQNGNWVVSKDCNFVFWSGNGSVWTTLDQGVTLPLDYSTLTAPFLTYSFLNGDSSFKLDYVSADMLWGSMGAQMLLLLPYAKKYVPIFQWPSIAGRSLVILSECDRLVLVSSAKTGTAPNKTMAYGVDAFTVNKFTLDWFWFYGYSFQSYDVMTVKASSLLTKLWFSPTNWMDTFVSFNLNFHRRTHNLISVPTVTSLLAAGKDLVLGNRFLVLSRMGTAPAYSIDKLELEYDFQTKAWTFSEIKLYITSRNSAYTRSFVREVQSFNADLSAYELNGTTLEARVFAFRADLMEEPSFGNGLFLSDTVWLRCSPNCLACNSSTYCYVCAFGFMLSADRSRCVPCAANCEVCSASACLHCAPGSYMTNSGICAPCDGTCLTCSGSSASCVSCASGLWLTPQSKCSACSDSACIRCVGSGAFCTQCLSGYSPSSAGLCVKCIAGCASCDPDKATTCLSCGLHYEFLNSTCTACPAHCLVCAQQKCTVCETGFTLNNATGTCSARCSSNCLTCADGAPNTCLSCYSDSTLSVTGQCVQNTACNANASCRSCEQFYAFNSSTCVACISLPWHCVRCEASAVTRCAGCADGYYLEPVSLLCLACATGCASCSTPLLCEYCQSGYTLVQGVLWGKCFACTSPCLTCYRAPTNCLSCATGYTLMAFTCVSSVSVSFQITMTSFNGTIDDIITLIAEAAKVAR